MIPKKEIFLIFAVSVIITLFLVPHLNDPGYQGNENGNNVLSEYDGNQPGTLKDDEDDFFEYFNETFVDTYPLRHR